MKKKIIKEKKDILSFILIIIGCIIEIYFIIKGIKKNTNSIQKSIFVLQNILLFVSFILNSIVQLSPKKKNLKIISKSFFLFSLSFNYLLFEISMIKDKMGIVFSILLFLVVILEIIFDSIKFRKTANNLFLSYLSLEILFSLKVLTCSDINTYYLLFISYIFLLIGGIINQYTKIRWKNRLWIIIELLSMFIINYYILRFVF